MTDRGPYPYNEYQETWLRDLETTDAQQTVGYLHRLIASVRPEEVAGYCCLGRACIAMGERPEFFLDAEIGSYDGEETILPWHVVEKLRLLDAQGTFAESIRRTDGGQFDALTELNDAGWSFKEIAAYIRGNPWNVFLAPDEGRED